MFLPPTMFSLLPQWRIRWKICFCNLYCFELFVEAAICVQKYMTIQFISHFIQFTNENETSCMFLLLSSELLEYRSNATFWEILYFQLKVVVKWRWLNVGVEAKWSSNFKANELLACELLRIPSANMCINFVLISTNRGKLRASCEFIPFYYWIIWIENIKWKFLAFRSTQCCSLVR